MKTRLIFIRHGESEANLRDQFAGDFDAALTERGRAQAECTAEALKDTQIDIAYASDLQRAYQTGEIIARPHGLSVIPDPGLREIRGGDWEGVTFSDIARLYPDDWACWRRDLVNSRCTCGESVMELAARIRAACERIARREEGKTVLIATHATPIRAMQTVWQGLPPEAINSVPWVSNASISIVDFENGEWTPAVIGEDGHLAALKTVLPDDV